LRGSSKSSPREYVEYKIMKTMHWTYDELMNTPIEVVQKIIAYMNTEAKYEQHISKQAHVPKGRGSR
jgi:hypothetical protein